MSTEESRWVSVLIKHLTVRPSQKLGRADLCAIWIDNKDLKGNHELRGQIPDEVRRSALFLPILSPGYVASSR
jgi:hypothetical protein